jgi:putative SOS response-associated peptidase YedK
MCYSISITVSLRDLERRFQAESAEPNLYRPIYHVSAFSIPYLPVIDNEDNGLIQFFQWGLIPFWTKDETAAGRIRFRTFNARAETIHTRPAFRLSIKSKRCLVPVDGFYEWREMNKKKYPYYIRLVDHNIFALAGIWDTWVNKTTGEMKNTFSIITTKANPLLEKIHNVRKRMPVILRQEDEGKWLSENLDASEINTLLTPYDENQMEAHTVSKWISRRGVDTNRPEVMEEYEYEALKD